MILDAGKIGGLPPGRLRVVEAGGVRIAVCNVDGRFYAVENRCTHDAGPLGEGEIENGLIRCPRHGALFDPATGAAVRLPAVAPVRSFPVRVEGETLLVEVDDAS